MMIIYDFGKRAKIPCGDCDDRGHCTMNCGPAIPPDKSILTAERIAAEAKKHNGAVRKGKVRWA